MRQQLLLAALGSTIVFGVALIRKLRAERRKASIEPRFKMISAATSNADIVVRIHKPLPQRRALPAAVLARIDSALAATGSRIGMPNLAVTAILAGAVIGFAAMSTELPPALAMALVGAASLPAPTFLV